MSDLRRSVVQEIDHLERGFDRASRGHYLAAEAWERRYYGLGLPATVLAGLAGVSSAADLPRGPLIVSALALASGSLTAALTFLDPRDRANHHRTAGEEFNCLRYEARQLMTIDERSELDDAALVERVKALTAKRHDLARRSLQIPTWAYDKAKGIVDAQRAAEAGKSVPVTVAPAPAAPRRR